jgi:hypothetical protein
MPRCTLPGPPQLLALAVAVGAACARAQAPPADWLLVPSGSAAPSSLAPWSSGALAGLALSNGLVTRVFVTNASGAAVFATYDLLNLLDSPDGESLLRGLSPEATLVCAGCAAPRGAQPGPGEAFRLVANNSAATSSDCVFVAQGDDSSLAACEAACWAQGTCNVVNYADAPVAAPLGAGGARRHGADGLVLHARSRASPAVRGTDCVLRVCADALAPALSPYNGFAVYGTPAVAASNSTRLGGLVAVGRDLSSGAYLNRSGLDFPGALVPDPASAAFTLVSVVSGPTQARFNWTVGSRGADPSIPWPPPGLRLTATFAATSGPWAGVTAAVMYEIFDGIPLIGKWVELSGSASATVVLDAVTVEDLALNPPYSPIASAAYAGQAEDFPGGVPVFPGAGKLFVASDMQYGVTVARTNDVVSRGGGAAGSTQPRLTASDDAGLAWPLAGATWDSVRIYELLLDDGPEQGLPHALYPSSETYFGCTLGPCVPGSGTPFEGGINERRGLAMRRFLLAVAPQVAESPLQYHLVASDSASIRAACDQMATVSWDMLVLSYGSGADIESTDPAYIARIAADVAYCKTKNVEVGMYDLIGWTRDPGHGWAALDASGSDTGNACLASGWGAFLQQQLPAFGAATGLANVETDGPYAGYSCSNASHGHTATNSVQVQSRRMAAVYRALRNAGWHINAPDSWFTAGINKMGVGYNEGTSRLPRREGSLIIRQVIYDATFYTQPAATWSFLPLAGCGSPECEYEPVSQNLGDFEVALSAHLAYGVSAFLYQGDTLYDTPVAQALLLKWSAFFHAFRPLLATGDLIHVRRPSGQGLDAVLHAKNGRTVPGLLAIFNPTDDDVVNGTLSVPLYYTGISTAHALVTWEPWPSDAGVEKAAPHVPPPLTVALDWRRRAVLTGIAVPARSMTWATVEPAA